MKTPAPRIVPFSNHSAFRANERAWDFFHAPPWTEHGFARIHRSYLVALKQVTGLRTTDGSMLVRLRANGDSPAVELPVSRRQAKELRDRLVRDPMRNLRPSDGGTHD